MYVPEILSSAAGSLSGKNSCFVVSSIEIYKNRIVRKIQNLIELEVYLRVYSFLKYLLSILRPIERVFFRRLVFNEAKLGSGSICIMAFKVFCLGKACGALLLAYGLTRCKIGQNFSHMAGIEPVVSFRNPKKAFFREFFGRKLLR